jgi:type IV secretory pathway VirD2 relaxase
MSARSSGSNIKTNFAGMRIAYNERTQSQSSFRGLSSTLMSESPSRIGKGLRQKLGAIDHNLNNDIQRIFQEDEANMHKIANSRADSKRGIMDSSRDL